MKHHQMSVITICALLLLLGGCSAPSQSGKVYSRDQSRTTQQVYYGTILHIEPVTIEGTDSGGGTLAGGALGGVIGSAFGQGVGKGVAAIGGAIGGALAGKAAEKGLTTVDGLEIEVKLTNGEILIVVQEKDGDYRVGDEVRLVRGPDGTTRIRP